MSQLSTLPPPSDATKTATRMPTVPTGSAMSTFWDVAQTNSPPTKKMRAVPNASEREQFTALAATWRADTSDLSQVSRIIADRSYLRLASFGKPAIPWILVELRERGGYWFPILEALTGAQPETEAERHSRGGMREAWLRWGRGEGYIR